MVSRLSRQASLLVPPLASDDNYLDIATLIARLQNIDLTPLLIYLVNAAEKTALPHLAEQFHVMGNEGWGFADTDAQKRMVIKSAIELHRYKGTPWAVKTAITQFGFETNVLDWFKYGGEPYYFRVEIDLYDQTWGQKDSDLAYGLIDQWKNLRSHLDKMAVYQNSFCHVKTASAGLVGENITVWPAFGSRVEHSAKNYLAVCNYLCEIITVSPEMVGQIEIYAEPVSLPSAGIWIDTLSIYPKQ